MERRGQSSPRDQLGRNLSGSLVDIKVVLIAAQSITLVKTSQRKIGLEMIVRDSNAGVVIGQRITYGFNFRPLFECHLQRVVATVPKGEESPVDLLVLRPLS